MIENVIFFLYKFQISGNAIAPPPLNRNLMYLNNNALGADSPTKLNSNATGQVHRRKYVDESKLRKVSFILLISVCDMSWIGILYLIQYIYDNILF